MANYRYRQMRRQGRQIRRAGMQPMFMFNADPGQLPESAVIVLARWAWRYRSELAPLAAMTALSGAGVWAHTAFPRWWPLILAGSSLAAWVAVAFGARLGLPTLAERIYAASTALVAGGWLAVADVLGPLAAPLPQALGIGGLLLSVPWWAHARRRAKVRVERKLAAWPVIARDIGLPGSVVMSAMVDVWGGGPGSGWRAARPSPT